MTIDWWTLGFQTVNVAILIWLLGHFFWKPVAGMIEARRASAQKVTEEAAKTRAEAAAALADVEKTRAGFAQEREAILADAHKAAEAAAASVLEKAKTDVAALQTAAQATAEKDRKAYESAWAERSAELAIDIAGRLAARLDGDAVQACFLEWLLCEIRKLPDTERNVAGAQGGALELVSALTLDAAEQRRFRAAIADALGGVHQIAFRTDDQLIAGFELRGSHLIINSSWRADLSTIQSRLGPEPGA